MMNKAHTAFFTALLALASHASAADHYAITDLGTLGDAAAASGINDQGVAVGYAVNLLYRYHGFTSDNGIFSAITPMGMTAQGQAMGINSSGQTIVAQYMLGELNTTALLYQNNMPTMIGSFMPHAINDSTRVVGSRFITDVDGMKYEQACSWESGVLSTLGQLSNGKSSIALALNDSGWAVGSATRPLALTPTATLWIDQAAIDLGTLGGTWSQATGVNDSNQIVGISHTSTNETHAFRYEVNAAGTVTTRTDLGVLGEQYSTAHAINNAGEIVGSSDNRAFIWADGVMVDLNTMIDAGSEWNLASATGINESGQIVGVGSLGGDPFRAFLLTPADLCPADLTHDGALDIFDLLAFIKAFNASDPAVDFTGDGVFDIFDMLAFLDAFNAGCAL